EKHLQDCRSNVVAGASAANGSWASVRSILVIGDGNINTGPPGTRVTHFSELGRIHRKTTVTLNGDDLSYTADPIPSAAGPYLPQVTWKSGTIRFPGHIR